MRVQILSKINGSAKILTSNGDVFPFIPYGGSGHSPENSIWEFPSVDLLSEIQYRETNLEFYCTYDSLGVSVNLDGGSFSSGGKNCYRSSPDQLQHVSYRFISMSAVDRGELDVYIQTLDAKYFAWPNPSGFRTLCWTPDTGALFEPNSGFALTLMAI